MKTSKFLNLNERDFLKGLLIAVISAVLTFVYELIQSGNPIDLESLKKIGTIALAALVSYLLKNLFTNSQNELLTKETNGSKPV